MRRLLAVLLLLLAPAAVRAAQIGSAVPWTQTDYTSNTATLTLPATNYLYETIAQAIPAALTIQLPSAPASGTFQCVKDRNNNFQSFNATVVTTDSSTVDMVAGATGYVMNQKGQANCFRFNASIGANGNWSVSVAYNAASPAGLFTQIMTAPPSASANGYSTWINQGTATETDNALGMSFLLRSQQNVHAASGLIKAAPATPYTATILLVWGAVPTQFNDTNVLLGWYDGNNAIDAVAINPYSGVLSYSHNTYASPTAPVNAPTPSYSCSIWDYRPGGSCSYPVMQPILPPSSMLWVQLANTGTTASVSASLDGENYQILWSFPVAGGFLSLGYHDLFIGGDAHFAQAQFTIASYYDISTGYSGPLDVIASGASGYQCYSVEPCSAAIAAAGTTAAMNVTNSTPVTCDVVVGLTGSTPTLKTSAACSGHAGVTAATFCGSFCTINSIYDQNAAANCVSNPCTLAFVTAAQNLVFTGCPGTVGYCIQMTAGHYATGSNEAYIATQTMNGVWETTSTSDTPLFDNNSSAVIYEQNFSGAGGFRISSSGGTSITLGAGTISNNAWHSVTGSFNSTSGAFIDADNVVTTGSTGSGTGSGPFTVDRNETGLYMVEFLYNPQAAIGQGNAGALCHNQSARYGLSLSC